MPRLGGWLGSRSGSGQGQKPAAQRNSTQSLTALEEPQHLQQALRATAFVMNDDVEAAEKALAQGNSAFHKLGKGVVTFLKAGIGLEPNDMREASERLYDAESSAAEQLRKIQRNPHGSKHSDIYPAGTEYSICQAEAQIMGAVNGVLTESLTESLKGFNKIRKAYATVNNAFEAERKYLGSRSSTSLRSPTSPTSPVNEDQQFSLRNYADHVADARRPSSPPTYGTRQQLHRWGSAVTVAVDDTVELEFFDARDPKYGGETPMYLGHVDSLEGSPTLSGVRSQSPDLPDSEPPSLSSPNSSNGSRKNSSSQLDGKDDPDDLDIFSQNPIDEFIHSGTNLNYGMLLVMLSLLPPTFGKLLSMIGLKGDRAQGLDMLWASSRFNNINGAIAGLILMSYYNGLVCFLDIIPSNTYPKERCHALLSQMRKRYPQSRLLLAEEARSHGADRRLEDAINLVASAPLHSSMKQVDALLWFDYSLNCLYNHNYAACADTFLKCASLSSWSTGLYHYLSAVAHVELYREAKYATGNAKAAKQHAQQAESLLHKLPGQIGGKKRLFGKQLPFDAFVSRKLNKWQTRAREWGVSLVDAVGVSPAAEMCLFWGGFARMREGALREYLARLAWSDGDEDPHGLLGGKEAMASARGKNPHWRREGLDEAAIVAVLRATVMRNLGKTEEARALLSEEVIDGNRPEDFKGGHKDNWTAPIARYEMAVNFWQESEEGMKRDLERKGKNPAEAEGTVSREANEEALRQCSEWIEQVARWDHYDLDTRFGMKVTTAKETLRKHGNPA